jgi:hypothetical protein
MKRSRLGTHSEKGVGEIRIELQASDRDEHWLDVSFWRDDGRGEFTRDDGFKLPVANPASIEGILKELGAAMDCVFAEASKRWALARN